MDQKGLISFKNVFKNFGNRNVITGLSLEVPENSFFGVVGLSGSGKTTLLNMLIGFWKPTKGTITFNDSDIWKQHRYVSNFFGFSTQGGSTYDNLTVEENMHYFGKLYNMPDDEIVSRTRDLLKLVELTGNERLLACELSTGMQRRLDIACALVHNPKVLILDEPTKDLDPFLRKEILAMLKRINKSGTTIVMTSHLLDEIETVSDVIAILHNGRILCCDTPINLKDKYSKNIEMQIKTYPGNYDNLAKHLQKLGLEKVIAKPSGIVAYFKEDERILPKVWKVAKANKEHILELKLSKPSMEEIFEAVTRK